MIIGLAGHWHARILKAGSGYQYTIFNPQGDAWAIGDRYGKNAEAECERVCRAILKRLDGTGYNKFNNRRPPQEMRK